MPIAIVNSAVMNAFLRPNLSPKCPHTTPPSGRARNATPNTLNDSSAPDVGLASGKNSSGKTSAAAVPKMKKSYHSMVEPTMLTDAILRISRSSTWALAPALCVVITSPRPGSSRRGFPRSSDLTHLFAIGS